MEYVRTIFRYTDTSIINIVKAITANVVAAFDHENFLTSFNSESFRKRCS
jgi:hypothetical protein